MTDGNDEQQFNRAPETPGQKPEKTGAEQPAREAKEQPLETKAEQGAPAAPTEAKTADFFQVLRKKPKVTAIPQVRDEVTVKIEKILEEGVGDAFARLSPVAKQEFKVKGEVVARKIRDLLKSSNIKAKKIFNLILEWLKLLPGVNRFFLEQEAKIKTDRVIAIHKQKNPQ